MQHWLKKHPTFRGDIRATVLRNARKLLILGVFLLSIQHYYLWSNERALTANASVKPVVKEGVEVICSSIATCDACALQYRSCLWCASQLACQPLHSPCLDAEIGHCSSIFLTLHPFRYRVIYVGKRSGGPEALIQLHLALLQWGFNSTLETRRKQVGGSLLPFFRNSYLKEFAALGVRMLKSTDYKAFLSSAIPQDILILTETWPCKKDVVFFNGGVRQLQYHLTIQDRRFTYDISHMYIPDAKPEACTIFTHTNFMSNVFLNQSSKSTLAPYVSPHIELRAAEFAQKTGMFSLQGRTIILYDGDAQFDANSVAVEYQQFLRKAASVKPHVLYEHFSKAICVIDFAMPGLERLVLEGSLFGAPVIINDELNGADVSDFPLPRRFRIAGRNYTQLNVLLRELFDASQNAERGRKLQLEFLPFRQYVTSLKSQFHRSVRKYFSDSVHFLVAADCFNGNALALKVLIASIFAFVPFATVTISFSIAESNFADDFNNEVGDTLKQLYLQASLNTVVSNNSFDDHPYHALYVVHVKRSDCFVGSYDFVSILATALQHKRAKDSRATLNVGDCFWFHERGSFMLHPAIDSLFRPLDDFVFRRFVELRGALASNSLWKAFFPFPD